MILARNIKLESPINIDGNTYFPVRGTLTYFDTDDGFPPEATDGIVALIRQDKEGNVFYRKPEDPIGFIVDLWMQGTNSLLDIFIDEALKQGKITLPEWPIWQDAISEWWDFGEDMIEFECPTLIGNLPGKRYLKVDDSYLWPSQPAAYVAYVKGLGRVGVNSDGLIAEYYGGDLLGTKVAITAGESIWDLSDPLLYSIQRGDGAYLVLNEENAPRRATDSVEGVGADAAGVSVSTGHNTLTVAAAAPAEVTVSDLAGRVVAKATVNGEQQFSLGAGIYLLTIDGHTRKITVK